MKKIISFILITAVSLLFLPATGESAESFTYQDGFSLGEAEAGAVEGFSWGWALGGLVGGSLLNVVGGGGVVTLAWINEPGPGSQTLKVLERRPTTYRLGYMHGYQTVINRKNMRHAAIGAGIGVAINTTLLLLFSQF